MNTEYYDIGLNLFCRQFPDPEKIISDAAAQGVACILTGTDPKENRQIDLFTKSHDKVWGTAGIHPHNADRTKKQDFELIEKLITSNSRIVAVGECGLDYDRMFSARENQIRCLEQHIVLAEKLGKPLFLHERSAADDFYRRFRDRRELCGRSVVHCFTGDIKTLEKYLDLGFNIGITGWICDDRRAGDLRKAVSILPLDRVMIETDAPYLTPRNVKGLGRTNLPQNVRYVAETLAKYMKAETAELVQAARENTERVFGLE